MAASTRPLSIVRKLSSLPMVIPHTWSIRGNSVADMVKDDGVTSSSMVFNFNCVVFQTLVHFVSVADSYGELSPIRV